MAQPPENGGNAQKPEASMLYQPYQPHKTLIAPARASARIWRILAGSLLLAALSYPLGMLYYHMVDSTLLALGLPLIGHEYIIGLTPLSAMLHLLAFGIFILALCLVVRLIHNRDFGSLFGSQPVFARQFRRALVPLLLLHAMLQLLPAPTEEEITVSFALGRWLQFLPFGLIAVFIQTTSEELIFRGYLQSQLAARFASPLIWMLIPSLLFGALHYDPGLPGYAPLLICLWALIFGLAMADLTARSGTLAPAMAMHFINNAAIMLIIAPEGAFSGMSLFRYPFSLEEPGMVLAWLPVDFMILLCGWLAVRISLRR